ncbi:MAG: alpha/beta hydrolase family protein [Vicinamibacterales bacterium]
MTRRTSIAALCLWAAAMLHPRAQSPTFRLPAPTGAYAVGTTTWHVEDEARAESFSGAGTSREVEVHAWYPVDAASGGRTAPYLREGLTEVQVFARLIRSSPTVFDGLASVVTHAKLDAPPASTAAPLPVLVFSHGYTAIPSSYTALMEDLASHGFGVLSVVHPFEATAATLADGRVVTMLDGGADRPSAAIMAVVGEWGEEDKTMAAVTAAADEGEQLRLTRGYLSGLRATDAALRRWTDDTTLVLSRLSALPKASAAARVAGRLDTSRLGAFGHSMGGVTAGQFCLEDARCKAALNLDGIPQYGTMIDKPLGRPFLMVYSARPGRTGASDVVYRRAASRYDRADVRDTLHLDFSDMIFWGGPLRERPVLGAVAPARAAEITRTIVREFFGQELAGRPSALLAGTTTLPEVTVKSFTSPAPGDLRTRDNNVSIR